MPAITPQCFPTFPPKTLKDYNKLLSETPVMEGKIARAGEKHIEFLDFEMGAYGRNWSRNAALTGDNTSTNRSFAQTL